MQTGQAHGGFDAAAATGGGCCAVGEGARGGDRGWLAGGVAGGGRDHGAALVVGSAGHAPGGRGGAADGVGVSGVEADDLAIPQLPPRQRKRLVQYIVRWSVDGLHWAEMRLDGADEAQCAADSYRVTLGKRAQVRIHRAWEVV